MLDERTDATVAVVATTMDSQHLSKRNSKYQIPTSHRVSSLFIANKALCVVS